ncbi:pilus assembly FimT family protein [Candidatus Uabimicrobium amorphum]|uniref:Prepilin-type N-terminal cleavage/methylation domain-containing protein n=1 Tax=Uabimicrobium amorphum TaxID=2596890 RepID=A0A5S9IQT3_UABAM|nr:type II secretion system protein [Candidatus Uabimicrobium amorphum]BBM85936.1 hypothetical protein UABAM_04322 [Candidatus Uabimicrobium amorphum]
MRRFSTVKGITLIELMVVMAIISIVLGASSAFFTQFNKRLAVQGAAFEIRNVLRSCKNYAAESQNKSTVRVVEDAVILQGSRLLGCWHLEKINQSTSDGFGGQISIEGGEIVPGKVGSAVSLKKIGQVNCGSVQALGLNNGFIISFWCFFYTGQTGNRTIFSLGENGSLQLTPQHTIVFNWGEESIQTPESIPLFEWVQLKIRCDGEKSSIFVNNIEEKSLTFTDFIPIEHYDAELIFAEDAQFKLDEIVVETLVELERYTLPENIVFGPRTTPIVFDEAGKLHPLYHQGNASITVIEQGTEKQFTVRASLMGQLKIEEKTEEQ